MATPLPPADRDRANDPNLFAPKSRPVIDKNREETIMRGITQELSRDFDELPEPKSHANTSNIDPVISGLLTHLPWPGSVWSMDARKLWLQIMEGAFDMIYKRVAEPEPQQHNNNDHHGTALQDQ